jgi:hypothetical protein
VIFDLKKSLKYWGVLDFEILPLSLNFIKI